MKKDKKKVSHLIELKRGLVITRVAAGMSIPSIAQEMGLNAEHLYRWVNSHSGMIALRESIGDANDILRARLPSLVTIALDALEKQILNGGPETKSKAAKIVLSTAGRLPTNPCVQCSARIINPVQ
jgi:transposase-like protein